MMKNTFIDGNPMKNEPYLSLQNANETKEEKANGTRQIEAVAGSPNYPAIAIDKNRRHSDPTHISHALLKLQSSYRYNRDVATGHLQHILQRRLSSVKNDEAEISRWTGIFMLCAVSLGVGVFVLPGILNLVKYLSYMYISKFCLLCFPIF